MGQLKQAARPGGELPQGRPRDRGWNQRRRRGAADAAAGGSDQPRELLEAVLPQVPAVPSAECDGEGFLPGGLMGSFPLLAALALEDIEPIRFAHLQRAHEALDRVVPVGETEFLDQVLVDALGNAPELELLLDPLPVPLAGRAGLLRWPSRWPPRGILPPPPRLRPDQAGGSPCDPPPSSARSRAARAPDAAAFPQLFADATSRRSPPHPRSKGGSVTSRRLQTLGADRRPFTSGVGDIQAATDGGCWVAARGSTCLSAAATRTAVRCEPRRIPK